MKKLLLSIAIAAGLSPAAFAQNTYNAPATGTQSERPSTIRPRTTAPATNNNGAVRHTNADPSGTSSYQNHTNEGTNGYRSPNGTMNGNRTGTTSQNGTGTSNPANNATLHQDYNNTVNPGSGSSTQHR